jgi:hypothetical protein
MFEENIERRNDLISFYNNRNNINRKIQKKGKYTLNDFDYASGGRDVLGNAQEVSQFSELYFSKHNIDLLNNTIRYKVFVETNQVIGRQDETNLLVVMKSMYLRYSNNPEDPTKFRKEVERLNNLVLEETVPKVISELKQYIKYMEDISTGLKPPPPAINSSIKGTKGYARGPSDILGLDVFDKSRGYISVTKKLA